MKELNYEKIMVVNFAVDERTIELSNYCLNRLGFQNVVTLQGKDGFRDKFLTFAKLAVESDCDCFVRSDADRLIFEGLFDLIGIFYQSDEVMCVEGQCFDYVMNRFRGATPHIFSREILEMLHNDHSLMPDSQKPESNFVTSVTQKDPRKFISVPILTNLHEYEQRPSKVCNAYLNRIFRGHASYYNEHHLLSLPDFYKRSISTAREFALNADQKTTMDHVDFSHLDDGFTEINSDQLEAYYDFYKKLYKMLIQHLSGTP